MRSAQAICLAGAGVYATSFVVAGLVTTTVAVPRYQGNSTISWTVGEEASYTEPIVNTTASTAVWISNSTLPTTAPGLPLAPSNATTSRPPEATGGAIPQQMQASIVGLLGFCIMSLVML